MISIFLVMMTAGILGGGAAHLSNATDIQSAKSADAPLHPWRSWFADLSVGVVAAFCVPIFLQITQSKLMDALWQETQTGPGPQLFYLAGFCLIAAFSSRAFLQSVSGQIFRVAEKQEKLELKLQQGALLQQNLELKQQKVMDFVAEQGDRRYLTVVTPSPISVASLISTDKHILRDRILEDADGASKNDLLSSDGDNVQQPVQDDFSAGLSKPMRLPVKLGDESIVMKALRDHQPRSLTSVARDTRLSREAVQRALDNLVAKGYVRKLINEVLDVPLYEGLPGE